MKSFTCRLLAIAGALLGSLSAPAQQRVPATPLIAHNPSFSVWSFADQLTDTDTTHWTGAPQPFTGIALIDGKPFRYMGHHPDRIPAMQQVANSITATHTRYRFSAAGVELEVTFFTPALMSDLDILSRPVTYLSWSAHSTDSASHSLSVMLDVSPVIAVNDHSEKVVTLRHQTPTLQVLSAGSQAQDVLNRSGDNVRIDWGYFHLAVPKSEPANMVEARPSERTHPGQLAPGDDIGMPEPAGDSAHLEVSFDLGSVSATPVARHVLVSYTQGYAIQYFERNLREYWQRNKMTVAELLEKAEADYPALEARGTAFDDQLTADLTKVGGKAYATIGILAYRQTLAAHELVADLDGQPMLFPKENFSNGCIATVDVLYPSSPFFLFFQPKLLEAQLLPVMEYSALPRWKFPFAPHDLGQFPLANGQVYGGGEETEENQMPVEESGNMLIMLDALARAEGNAHLAGQYWPQLTGWANYLREKGLDPENQLTTDDFAGHVAHNANLSIKAIDGLAAYADLARMLNHEAVAKEYKTAAKGMAEKWVTMAAEGDHYKLAFNSPDTWSQKYNLVWDKLLDYNLFPDSVREKELAFYQTKINTFGLPLDSRKDYTKLDWSLWTATLATKPEQFNAMVEPIAKWISEAPDRVPLTDWYDTKTGKQEAFQARSVVGGVFIKALSDRELTTKYRKEAANQ